MEEERVVRSRVLDKPMHSPQYVLLGGLAHGILLVIGEKDHIFALVVEILDEVGRHVPDIIDTASKLAALAEVVDADKQGFPSTGTGAVLEGVILRGAMAEILRTRWRRRRSVHVAMVVRIRAHRGNSFIFNGVSQKLKLVSRGVVVVG